MSPLRDLLIAPRPAEHATPRAPQPPARMARLARRRHAPPPALSPALGVLAPARELSAVASAAGLAIARGRSAALVCLHASGAAASPSLRAPAHAGAGRLAASLTARGLAADARGRLAVVRLPDDPAELSSAAARALAAAGALPTVLAVAQRSEDVDVLLGAQDAILVALAPAAEPTLAGLALAGATELAPSAVAISLALDPVQRALALAGAWSPRTIRHAIEGLVA
jgi:hypothetical protein